MNKQEIRTVFEKFTKNNDFILNPDKEFVDKLIDGILVNENKYGLKLCPCKLRDGTRERDLELICPCNFNVRKFHGRQHLSNIFRDLGNNQYRRFKVPSIGRQEKEITQNQIDFCFS